MLRNDLLRHLAAFGIACSAMLGAAEVHAHAVLLETSPQDGAILSAAPAAVALRFNEPVTPVSLRVLDANGNPVVAPGTVQTIDGELHLALPPDLRPGGYIVSYRVVSADSHPVSGAFAFSVGDAVAITRHVERESEGWATAKIALYFVQHVALLLAAGTTLFVLAVLRGAPLRGLAVLIQVSAGFAIALSLVQIGVEGGLLALAPVTGLLDPAIWRLGALTTLGTSAAVIVPSLILVMLGVGRPAWRVVILIGALGAPAGLALTGHTAATGGVAQGLQALHALTAAFWLGSLAPLAVVLRTKPPAEAALLTRRFSTLAIPAVTVLLIAGVGAVLIRTPSPLSLIGTDYGRLLAIKLGFVALLLACAAVNRFRLTPALSGDSLGAAAQLRTSIRLEIVLAIGVLIATAFLAHTPPPHDMDEHAHEHGSLAPGYALVTASGDRTILIEVTPAQAGANTIDLYFSSRDGGVLALQEVTVELSRPDIGVEALSRSATMVGPGHYRLAVVPLSPAGTWQLHIDALINDFEKAAFETEIPIQ